MWPNKNRHTRQNDIIYCGRTHDVDGDEDDDEAIAGRPAPCAAAAYVA